MWFGTFEDVMRICYPDLVGRVKDNKDLWFKELPNGSRIWFGGLDDKERVDKILGNEYSTIFLNEVSEMSWDAVGTVISRLAEKSELVNKMLFDCNPTSSNHWTYQLFIKGVQPDTGKKIAESMNYQYLQMNPVDNLQNIDGQFIKDLENASEGKRRRFLYGEYAVGEDIAVFKDEWLRKEYEGAPRVKYIVQIWDTAFKTKEYNDPSAGLTIGVGEDGYYLLDIINKRLDYPALKEAVNLWAKDWRPDLIIIEDKASGQSLLQDLRRTTKLPLAGFNPGRADKVERAMYAAQYFEQGKFFLGKGESFDEFRAQLLMFPLAEFDDMVDCVSAFFLYAKDNLLYDINAEDIYTLEETEFVSYSGSAGNSVTGY